MTPREGFFLAFAAIAMVCALLVVFKRNPVASAFALVLTFFAFGGMYAVLDAHLIAAMQILVYAGAIMVLFVFVIMLLGADQLDATIAKVSLGFKAVSVAAVLGLAGIFIRVILEGAPAPLNAGATPEAIEAAGGNTQVLSEVLFSKYLLPFELTSVLLLAAIIGSVIIAMRRKGSAQ